MLEGLASTAASWRVLETRDGEAVKRVAVAERLWSEMVAGEGKRDCRVLAFGGGTVGDLAGFVAGTFLRGVGWIAVPTTLLAQVDAAIGGKTGVNLPEAKNSVGLFHHPEAVVCDTRVLGTLEPEELRSGLFEVVKIGAIWDAGILDLVEADLPSLLEGDAQALAPVVARAVRAKVEVVEADPEEGDSRRLLNFGHTLGHALEGATGYEALRHGEAVGYGMLFALGLAAERGLPATAADRLRKLIGRIGLPALPAVEADTLRTYMARDKKARREGLAWVYPVDLGKGRIDDSVSSTEVDRALTSFMRDPWA